MSPSGSGLKRKLRGIENGWFTETATMWPGQRFSLALENFSEDSILFHQESEFQDILVFQSAQYGKVFAINGILQLTEKDEHAFHEMMAHLPLFAHSNPKNILIVGGGDGGVLREVCRHSEVEHVTLVEIDPLVIKASKEYLKLTPETLFEDPRVEIVHADAAEFLRDPNRHNKYDVIIGDTLDPLGPAETLFDPEFYESMHAALRSDGLICTQGESMWIHLDLICDLLGCCCEMFDHAEYATTSVPSLPCGQIGFILARKGKAESCRMPLRDPTFQSDLRWYNPDMHQAAFVLPQSLRTKLNHILGESTDSGGFKDEDCFLSSCNIL